MARYKPNQAKLETLEDVDLALKEIGLLEKELDALDAEAHKIISTAKEDAAKKGEPMRKRITEISSKIGAFAEYNKDDLFKDKKTVELTFGIFGFRKSTSISVKKTTINLMQKLGLTAFLRTKVEPDKEKMAELDDETLSQVDAVRKIKNDFFCQPNKEEVNKDLLKSAV
ncbi:host-nuclease inhibitor Gam family protein [Treponema sp. OMZ 787]|uniref:host-nuclease inhibitor Gam family protein n=1 Tax=Treponema sp. OMZ 787 TaxID=2563669 RepID=UPI0020A3A872|nr:host-nuclease inhibitor Gam family protein [Treponema sp. OMZ 787]UTC62565.1 host-nuclease inhibitor Gam family protein [Treponema sp. OMZ 787]